MAARGARFSARGAIRGILWLQVALALLLIGGDAARVLPRIAWPTTAPPASEPVRPGDQTRRYAPRELPERRPGLPFTVPDSMPSRLGFEVTGTVMRLTGQIAEGDGLRFAEALARRDPAPQVVALLSPGGSVMDALAIGRTLREAGLATRVEEGAFCFSACPYILAGGVEREVHRDGRVGVHQHYFGESVILPALVAVENIQRGQAEVMGFLDEMGVSPLLMRHALETPPAEIYVLLPDQLADYALATSVLPAD
jgi:hypothetical protein